MTSIDQKLASFDQELAKARAKKEADSIEPGEEAAAEAARRDEIRRDSKVAAHAALPELQKAIRALQASARRAAGQSRPPVDGVRVMTKQSLLKRSKVTYWDVEVTNGAYWDVRVIRVPRKGVPTAYRPGGNREPRELSLESFADEAHWWWTAPDNWAESAPTQHEADAAEDFRAAIECIARYLAQIT